MKKRLKAVLIIGLCLVCFACMGVLFACSAPSLSVELSVPEAELTAGAVVSLSAKVQGDTFSVKKYNGKHAEFYVEEQYSSVATVSDDGKLKIKSTADAFATFVLVATLGDLSVEKRLSVAPSHVQTVSITSGTTVNAGDVMPLSAVITPKQARSHSVTYTVTEGNNIASVTGSNLIVSDLADRQDVIKIVAQSDGVQSEEVQISIATVQVRDISLTSTAMVLLPEDVADITCEVTPQDASFLPVLTVSAGAEYCAFSEGRLIVNKDAPIGASVTVTATAGAATKSITLRINYVEAQGITVNRGSAYVHAAETKTFGWEVFPKNADATALRVRLVDGADKVQWQGGGSFTVNADAEAGSEITFSLELDSVQTSVTFIVAEKVPETLQISTEDNLQWLKSGESVRFSANVLPVTYGGGITYRAVEGAELVQIEGATVTVRQDADAGKVKIVAETDNGTASNSVEFTVCGKYTRKVLSSFDGEVKFNSAAVWLVLPAEQRNANKITVIVPATVKDLIIEGVYDGTAATVYDDLYFYFRAPEGGVRNITFMNFATRCTAGLGGTVVELGGGTANITLVGQNSVTADSPYLVENAGEKMDGIWGYNTSNARVAAAFKCGKDGYNGTAGGTAISGCNIVFTGAGSLVATAGSGADGSVGGKGADALYAEDFACVGGNGGRGGNGGDSGCAIFAKSVYFKQSGVVTACAGNAGKGGSGGKGGSVSAVSGNPGITAIAGQNGVAGLDGVPQKAITATVVTGYNYVNDLGAVVGRGEGHGLQFNATVSLLSAFYGVEVLYGNALYNPFKYSLTNRYSMTKQTDLTELTRQAKMLEYTMGQMPKNYWNEIYCKSSDRVTIYFVDKINSSGSVIYGVTAHGEFVNYNNSVWIATFNTGMRGVVYSNYFNIMLHEFVHLAHYNLSGEAQKQLTNTMKGYNFDSYGNGTRQDNVYGVKEGYGALNSCYLSAYSRTNNMEDVAETVSMIATFTYRADFLAEGTTIYKKYKYMCEVLRQEFETLNASAYWQVFAYPHLFD